jgi:hypothetical protein
VADHRAPFLCLADNLIYTNLGMGGRLDEALELPGRANLMSAAGSISAYHERVSDELVHRAFKDFGFEQLPFHRFVANTVQPRGKLHLTQTGFKDAGVGLRW